MGLVEGDKREPGYAEMATAGGEGIMSVGKPLKNFTSGWRL